MENNIIGIGKRLDNLNNVIKNSHPQDTWILDKVLPLFMVLINSATTPEQEQRIINIMNPLFDNYEYRFGLTLENIGQQIARELLEQSTPIVALYPGKFKPPHAGHFDVVKQASTIADDVIVIMSNIPKDEFTAEQSMKVWSLYKDLLPSNVEIKVAIKSSPINDVFDIVKDKTRDFIVLYGKGERSRYASIERDREKYSNVQIVDAGTFENLNATDLRTAIRNKDLEDIQKFLPKGIDAKKMLSIYTQDEFKPGPMIHESIIPQEKFAQETGKDWAEVAVNGLAGKDKYDLKNYEVAILPLDKIKPTQFGEDYINASSEYEAEQYKKYMNGEIGVEDLRKEDFFPIVVDKDTMEILDGNHRHAVHKILNIPNIKVILISKKQSLNESFDKDLPNIAKVNCSLEWVVTNNDDIEAKFCFRRDIPENDAWSLHWMFTENSKNKSSEAWKLITVSSYKVLREFINLKHPKSLSISGDNDKKTNIYKLPTIVDKLKVLFNNEYRVDNSGDYEVVLRSIEESAKSNIKKRMETMNESYDQSLNYFKNGDIFSKSRIERNDTLKKYNSRKQLHEVYNIPFKSNLILEAFTKDKAPLIQKLVTFACEQLQIEQPPIKLINSPSYTQEHSSFGGYYPSEQKIVCVVHNRNMADILRTLAHELVHHMQNGKGELDSESGEDGSPIENEANATAGIIMRKFGRDNPQIFEGKINDLYLDIDKFNQPKQIDHYLLKALHEVTLSKDNAVLPKGGLTQGTFQVGDKAYQYYIRKKTNPYNDGGNFYNVEFYPQNTKKSTPLGDTPPKDYLKILSTMFKIIMDFIEQKNPDYIGIASLDNPEGKNYHTVYNNLTDNKANLIPGYFRKNSNLLFTSLEGEGRIIVMKKKQPISPPDEVDEYDVENEQDSKEFTSFLKEYSQQLSESELNEAEYHGRKVTLGKPMQGDIKKFKVYVKNSKGKVVKVNFGQKGMNIKKNNPVRRKAYRARHNCDNPGPRDKANYWSCRKW